MARTIFFAAALAAGLAVACSGGSVDGTGSSDVTGEAALHGEREPFAGFSFDSGLLPKGSPAQVALKLSTGSKIAVDASARAGEKGLEARPQSGKLSIDLKLSLDGQLKVDTALKKYDGPLPGLKDLDIPVHAEVAFDPFLLAQGDKAVAEADVPPTALPEIPLGSVPGKLALEIAPGSKLRAQLSGKCARVSEGAASWSTTTVASGTIILSGKIKLDLPAPLNKEIELPKIEIPLPEAKGSIVAKAPGSVAGPDSALGTCEGGPDADKDPAPTPPPPPAKACTTHLECGSGEECFRDTCQPRRPSLATVTVDGVPAKVTAVNLVADNQWGPYEANIRFEGAGFAPGSTATIVAHAEGGGCETSTTLYVSSAGSAPLAPTTGAGCGFVITSVPSYFGARFSGTFNGNIASTGSRPVDKRVTIEFDATN